MAQTTRAKSPRRRDELRRNLPRPSRPVLQVLQRPEFVGAAMILLAFIVAASAVMIWSRDQIKVSAGQIATDVRLKRLNFTVVDAAATDKARDEARSRAPEVYTLDEAFLESLRAPLENLPVLVAQQPDLAAITPHIRETYALTQESLPILAAYAQDGNPTATWTRWVDELLARWLPENPLIDADAWQRGLTAPETPILRGRDGTAVVRWRDAIPIRSADDPAARKELRQLLEPIGRMAGFHRDVVTHVAAAVSANARPTYVRNDAMTAGVAEERAAAVETVRVDHRQDEVIYRAGDRLTNQQLATLKTEMEHYEVASGLRVRWYPRLGIFGLVATIAAFLAGFLALFYPRAISNAVRLVALLALMFGTFAFAAALAAQVPKLLHPAAIASVLLVAIIVRLAYDQRLALFVSTVQCGLTALALEQDVGWFFVLMGGCGAMVGQLRRLRNRNTLIRAAILTALVLGVATLLHGAVTGPIVPDIWTQIGGAAAWAIAASVVVGFLILGILPSIERAFDITTGMTLAELRDPGQPLLRQLQQLAPGTYNHSLQVATIAEAAADAIDADSLLIYVGALYHDIGKMNKPMYFVENQAGGFNKHSRLRPAMSLLVIIGHVKDGIELAREYGLPRQIQHFIESHHGTTLVEYFYHAARSEAEADEDKCAVDEVVFRYPGPKPRTKEAAILMIADAVESATRAMTEPNPGRIENLVRELSRKRLLDGQFDECNLTFRELGLIEDAVIARLCAIHHGRISYPTTTTRGADVPESAAAS